MVQWSSTTSDEAILTNGPGFESGDSQLEFEVQHVLIVLFCKSSYVVLGPYLSCSFCGRFVVRQPGSWQRKRHFEANIFHFRQMKWFWKAYDPLRQFHEAVLVLQFIFAVCEATSSAAPTGVAILKLRRK